MHHQPDGAAFDIVLIAHVGCVVVALATLVASASTASRLRMLLRDDATLPEAVARYFRPGVNWAGRTAYGIPVFGLLLLALSQGAYALREGWIMGGLAIMVAVVLIAEGLLWPAERRLQVLVPALHEGTGGAPREETRHQATTMVLSATSAIVLLVIGSALMVVQP